MPFNKRKNLTKGLRKETNLKMSSLSKSKIERSRGLQLLAMEKKNQKSNTLSSQSAQ
jgi:hypothetical protein